MADLWVETADDFLYGSGSVSLSRSAFEATFDLYSKYDESEPAGSASASAALTTLDRLSQSEEFGDSRFTIKGVMLGVAGSLTVETASGATSFAMDETSCQAGDVRFSELPDQPERPEPVENDTPETAIPLKLGDKVLVNIAGAEESPEVPCLVDDGEGGTFEGLMTQHRLVADRGHRWLDHGRHRRERLRHDGRGLRRGRRRGWGIGRVRR